MELPWCLKHAPRSLEEFAGNDAAKETLHLWALNWSRGQRGKPLLVYGPTGVGKTALVQALAREMSWSIAEPSVGATRESGGLQSSLRDLFGKTRLVFIDEVDALEKSVVRALPELLKENSCPTILAADDAWERRLQTLRAHCALLELKRVNWREIARVLSDIARKEEIDAGFVEEIARESGGDLRSAINDLQASAGEETLLVSARNRQENIFEGLRKVFGAKNFLDAVRAGDDSDVDLRMFLKWIEENLALEFEGAELSEAFERVSRADVFEGRIRSRQDYGLMKYVRALGLGGVAAARKSSGAGAWTAKRFVRYQFPSSIKQLSETRRSRELLGKVVSKTMRALHCSRSQALEMLFLLAGRKKELAGFLELSDDEEKLFSELYYFQEH